MAMRIGSLDPSPPSLRRQVARRSRGQIIHHADGVAVEQQAVDKMGADEPRSTRHQRAWPLPVGQAVTIPSRGHVFQRPRVKSGNSAGRLPFATDHSDSGVTALMATASYTFMSVGSPSRRHLMSR